MFPSLMSRRWTSDYRSHWPVAALPCWRSAFLEDSLCYWRWWVSTGSSLIQLHNERMSWAFGWHLELARLMFCVSFLLVDLSWPSLARLWGWFCHSWSRDFCPAYFLACALQICSRSVRYRSCWSSLVCWRAICRRVARRKSIRWWRYGTSDPMHHFQADHLAILYLVNSSINGM